MPHVRTKSTSRPASTPPKVAVTVRLDPARVQQLQAAAEAEIRSLTNHVETALLRDLAHRDEASRVITMRVAHEVAATIDPDDIASGADESDAAYTKRQELMLALWSIPASD